MPFPGCRKDSVEADSPYTTGFIKFTERENGEKRLRNFAIAYALNSSNKDKANIYYSPRPGRSYLEYGVAFIRRKDSLSGNSMAIRITDLNLDTLQVPYTFVKNKSPYFVISYDEVYDKTCGGFTGLHNASLTITSKKGDRLKGNFSGIRSCSADNVNVSSSLEIMEGEFDVKLVREP